MEKKTLSRKNVKKLITTKRFLEQTCNEVEYKGVTQSQVFKTFKNNQLWWLHIVF